MRILWAGLGVLVLAVGTADAVWTTIAASHGGPLTRRVSMLLWKGALRAPLHAKRRYFLRVVGTAIPLGTVLTWIGLVWLGWSSIFLSAPGALVDARDHVPAGVLSRFAFVLSALSTVGDPQHVPGSAPWQLLSPIASLHGLAVVTLGITYLIPLAGADIEKRGIAVMIGALGTSPTGIVLRAWNGHDFGFLGGLLAPLGRDLATHAERHLAYPALHYLHAGEQARATSVSIARLDEALAILQHGVADSVRPELGAIEVAREAVAHYARTLGDMLPARQREAPDLPSLAPLAAAGIPLQPRERFRAAMRREDDRRRKLRLLVLTEGWTWDQVIGDDRPDRG